MRALGVHLEKRRTRSATASAERTMVPLPKWRDASADPESQLSTLTHCVAARIDGDQFCRMNAAALFLRILATDHRGASLVRSAVRRWAGRALTNKQEQSCNRNFKAMRSCS